MRIQRYKIAQYKQEDIEAACRMEIRLAKYSLKESCQMLQRKRKQRYNVGVAMSLLGQTFRNISVALTFIEELERRESK